MPDKKPPGSKKPKKDSGGKEKRQLPARKWCDKATERGYKTVNELVDEVLTQILESWSEGDVLKAIPYLTGAVQALAVQLGRVESILGHAGYISPPLIHHMTSSQFQVAYDAICNMMHRDDAGLYELKVLAKVAAASSVIPRKPTKPKTDGSNVIRLPVFAKKED